MNGTNKIEDFAYADKAALIIDDDPFIREVMVTTLQQLGFKTVLDAENGHYAVKQLNSITYDVDLILCDLEMPKVDGIETLRLLSNIKTKAGILIVSSHNEQLLSAAEELTHGYGLRLLGSIRKPIRRSDIEAILPLLSKQNPYTYSRLDYNLNLEELNTAIKKNQLVLHYQPKAMVSSLEIKGLEALVRWNHPQHGLIGAGAFVPLVEDTPVMAPMTNWVLDRALQECAPLLKNNVIDSVSVNLSVNALKDVAMPQRIEATIKEAGLSKNNLILELTEGGLIEDVRTTLNILSRLTIKGFNLSIDDFGTGYSSLQQLLRVSFSELKLDRSFVDGAANNRVQRIILESTVELAHRLNLTTVAEGAETQIDMAVIEECGVSLVQGYFIQKPLPMDELVTWIKQRNS